ncbi:2-C-methyl-D-erythritol 2,4-cyclodiphosphate synthase [Desulfocapsa sulfexigens DSM 10523]|uniref:Bifunctional enzyme IspD/IspF n=1 Tax=Desulfocapsa sulfexigens (strain DSM 10523 / SB164P1) TaxID=1167006 RepID=M1PDL0_DESSD|nr:2-C-methyl-D-erythritol 4-phosphate cytidylyltransferase [Desulfocapsa sulfexigens]AGF77815.1 2-C-methyl-D-erythritol 2,4-cyclodiphosphate synthase [Desulfocapsa sulfexigens DSM 10523]
MPTTAAIIPAAGSGSRMGLDHPKQYHLLAGIPILVHTVRVFTSASCVDMIVVVVPAERVESTVNLMADHGLSGANLQVIAGGERRQDSVKAGLDSLNAGVDIVLVHDGARPLLAPDLIDRCCDAAIEYGAAIAAVPVKDTLKKGGPGGRILHTVDRKDLWQAQTPQASRLSLLLAAYDMAGEREVTDEASLLELAGTDVHLVEGSETNIKITRPDDLIIAEKIMQNHETSSEKIRIGHGYDAHKFASDRALVLGGVTVPFEMGLAGHSDADVLTHALCDAILGALGAGDIGSHFPDSDQEFLNVYSVTLLERVVDIAAQRGFVLSNADITVVCQKPKLAPFVPKMKEILAEACGVDLGQVNVKATTTEKMGFTGRMEGISSHAVVLLAKEGNCK